jgi:acyl-CoA reductase-like NAD-dependent aldehyde dehydrogenase
MSDRLSVKKTYKLFINGAFPRSESGRTFAITSHEGTFLANLAQGSRKDVRDAVVAARGALAKWSSATAYNRGQVLYRLAELMESRRSDIASLIADVEGLSESDALEQVNDSVDLLVWYAGWTDKLAQVLGSSNPVAGPYFNFSTPVPTGVIGVVAPSTNALLGLVATVAPALAASNVVVVVAGSPASALLGIILGELCETSDVPAGVVNVITGFVDELGATLASHEDIDGLDLAGAYAATEELATLAANSIKRVVTREPVLGPDDQLTRLRAFSETTTVWHTVGF